MEGDGKLGTAQLASIESLLPGAARDCGNP